MLFDNTIPNVATVRYICDLDGEQWGSKSGLQVMRRSSLTDLESPVPPGERERNGEGQVHEFMSEEK